ncbi:hypothetical protein M0D46_10955 [Xanthomonas prunicola]|uniref:hypothetical protein n=1 Tax=Xanthomonas prunicola TaxID=2053930 RepID=UPI0021B227F6|nr:hypothetical protein [Xanthomonas prunicola]UXA71755.1 hypothetical protein M0D46_10955 [Xanthomonas prunicola]
MRAAAGLGDTVTVLHDACATTDLDLDGSKVPAAHVQTTMMTAFQFGHAAVRSTQAYLQRQ